MIPYTQAIIKIYVLILSLSVFIFVYNLQSYRSKEIAISVKTLAQIEVIAMNWLMVQYILPYGQSLYTIYE